LHAPRSIRLRPPAPAAFARAASAPAAFAAAALAMLGMLVAVPVGAGGALAAEPVQATGQQAEPPAPDPAATTLTAVGQPAPPVRVATLGGNRFDLADQRGKVVLVNFWATWCPPCRQEMPHLQERVWQRFGDRRDFVLVSIAREETAEVIAPFVAEHGYGWVFAPDPDRSVYAGFAGAYIPRNYVVGRDGTILYQSQGFEEAEFATMVEVIAGALAEGS